MYRTFSGLSGKQQATLFCQYVQPSASSAASTYESLPVFFCFVARTRVFCVLQEASLLWRHGIIPTQHQWCDRVFCSTPPPPPKFNFKQYRYTSTSMYPLSYTLTNPASLEVKTTAIPLISTQISDLLVLWMILFCCKTRFALAEPQTEKLNIDEIKLRLQYEFHIIRVSYVAASTAQSHASSWLC